MHRLRVLSHFFLFLLKHAPVRSAASSAASSSRSVAPLGTLRPVSGSANPVKQAELFRKTELKEMRDKTASQAERDVSLCVNVRTESCANKLHPHLCFLIFVYTETCLICT